MLKFQGFQLRFSHHPAVLPREPRREDMASRIAFSVNAAVVQIRSALISSGRGYDEVRDVQLMVFVAGEQQRTYDIL